jgi:hypothetical protein
LAKRRRSRTNTGEIADAGMDAVRQQAERESARLERMGDSNAESA